MDRELEAHSINEGLSELFARRVLDGEPMKRVDPKASPIGDYGAASLANADHLRSKVGWQHLSAAYFEGAIAPPTAGSQSVKFGQPSLGLKLKLFRSPWKQ